MGLYQAPIPPKPEKEKRIVRPLKIVESINKASSLNTTLNSAPHTKRPLRQARLNSALHDPNKKNDNFANILDLLQKYQQSSTSSITQSLNN